MEEQELRIGNIVDRCGEIQVLTKEWMVFILEGGIESFAPVPLTEEWLVKFGFEKEG